MPTENLKNWQKPFSSIFQKTEKEPKKGKKETFLTKFFQFFENFGATIQANRHGSNPCHMTLKISQNIPAIRGFLSNFLPKSR